MWLGAGAREGCGGRQGTGWRRPTNGLLVLGKDGCCSTCLDAAWPGPHPGWPPSPPRHGLLQSKQAHWRKERAGCRLLGLPYLLITPIFRPQFSSGLGYVLVVKYFKELSQDTYFLFASLNSDQDLGTWTANKEDKGRVCLPVPSSATGCFLGCLWARPSLPWDRAGPLPQVTTLSPIQSWHRGGRQQISTMSYQQEEPPCIVLWSLT